MKIIFEPKSYKIVKGAILLLAIALMGYVAYAATQLSVSNTGTVILGSANYAGVTFSPPSSAPTCSTATYSQTPSPITWGSIPNDGTTVTTAYICIQNNASARTVTVSTNTAATGITVQYNGAASFSTPIASSGTLLVTVTLTATTSAPTGAFGYTTLVA